LKNALILTIAKAPAVMKLTETKIDAEITALIDTKRKLIIIIS
jgi:hypothetical protein